MIENCKSFPLSESALTVDFGNSILPELNARAIALADHLESNPFPGLVEAVPAYASTTIFYDLRTVRREFAGYTTAYSAVEDIVRESLAKVEISEATDSRMVEVPVRFDLEGEFDLDLVAEGSGLSKTGVIDVFTSSVYRVYMLGFLPGFTYLGQLDERIATPRKDTPRTQVPKGSIGIAGRQTGIYSLSSPGGWQIIGRTELELFDPLAERLCLLRPGDNVRFLSVCE